MLVPPRGDTDGRLLVKAFRAWSFRIAALGFGLMAAAASASAQPEDKVPPGVRAVAKALTPTQTLSAGRTLSARRNPEATYAEFAPRVSDLAPGCWNGSELLCAINSGFALAAPATLSQMANRTFKLVAELEKRGLGDPPWHVEQLAASLAAGEVGLTSLGDEWNVTPQSPVPDSAVRLWHFNDAVAATRRIKRNLSDPEVVLASLATLEKKWPTTVRRFRDLYHEVMAHLEPSRPRRRTAGTRRATAKS